MAKKIEPEQKIVAKKGGDKIFETFTPKGGLLVVIHCKDHNIVVEVSIWMKRILHRFLVFPVLALHLIANLEVSAEIIDPSSCDPPGPSETRIHHEEGVLSMHDVTIILEGADITHVTSEIGSCAAIYVHHEGEGKISIDISGHDNSGTVKKGTINRSGDYTAAIYVYHKGENDIDVIIEDTTITTSSPGALRNHPVYIWHVNEGDIDVSLKGTEIATSGGGTYNHAVLVYHGGEGDIDFSVEDSRITTPEVSYNRGINLVRGNDSIGTINITIRNTEIETAGTGSGGLRTTHHGEGGINLVLDGSTISTRGDTSSAVLIEMDLSETDATVFMRATSNTITTVGHSSRGLFGRNDVTGDVRIVSKSNRITTRGELSRGIEGFNASTKGDIEISSTDDAIVTEGTRQAMGILALHQGNDGRINLEVRRADITTEGETSLGMYALHLGNGNIDLNISDSTISTSGETSMGVQARRGAESDLGINGDISIRASSNTITTEGDSSRGIVGVNLGTGDIRIDTTSNHISTRGEGAHGIFGDHAGKGNIEISSMDDAIVTEGSMAHGIFARHDGTSQDQGITIHVGGNIKVLHEDSYGVGIGYLDSGTVHRGGSYDESGHRRQMVNLTGSIDSAGTSLFLAGGGRVFIGPEGFMRTGTGRAILVHGDTPGENEGDPVIKPKLHLDINLGERSIAEVIGDGWILNDGGGTTIIINGVKLHDSSTGVILGAYAPVGIRDIRIRPEGVLVDHEQDPWVISEPALGIITDRDFSAADFIFTYAPRGALYEVVPNFLLGLNRPVSPGSRMVSSGSPFWTNLSTENMSYQPSASTLGAEYGSRINGIEAGVDFRLGDDLAVSASIRSTQASADVSAITMVGGGKILAEGHGLALGLSLDRDDGWYARSGLFLSDYKLAFHSANRGTVADGIGSRGLSLDFEIGRNIKLGRGIALVPRIGAMRTSVSMQDFTDRVGSNVRMPKTFHRAFNVGLVIKFKNSTPEMGGDLSLKASIDFEKSHDGESTRINVSGEDLISMAPGERFVLGLEGHWQRDSSFVSVGARASVSNSDNRRFSGYITFGMTF
ncbi:MAG: autotransporter outer membrane beta-barrel domain-containing protein [Rhodobacteraceae bacterium]|nr:autotransporter outer membrane beta-barrel domain-containing protein [Paracoccaceae bacterium]